MLTVHKGEQCSHHTPGRYDMWYCQSQQGLQDLLFLALAQIFLIKKMLFNLYPAIPQTSKEIGRNQC